MIDILKLYRKYRIEVAPPGHKHDNIARGWVQVKCPLCTGNPGYHMGYCVDPSSKFVGNFRCFRCGPHPGAIVISTLLRTSRENAENIIKRYSGKRVKKITPTRGQTGSVLKVPSGIIPLLPHHANYLIQRQFDPLKLIDEYNISSTGPISNLYLENKEINYSHRIFIPIYWEGRQVSYQARDVTEKHKSKYMACPPEAEIISLKKILYGNTNGKRCVLVEGVTDVWRLGFGSVCCYGIEFTVAQIRLLAKYDKVFPLFDPDPQAIKQQEKIIRRLRFAGAKVIDPKINLKCDPGDMGQDDANHLMRELGL